MLFLDYFYFCSNILLSLAFYLQARVPKKMANRLYSLETPVQSSEKAKIIESFIISIIFYEGCFLNCLMLIYKMYKYQRTSHHRWHLSQ